MIRQVHIGGYTEPRPRGGDGGGVAGGGGTEGQLPFWRIVPGNRDRKEEAGAGNCTHCPNATQLPWAPHGAQGALGERVHALRDWKWES